MTDAEFQLLYHQMERPIKAFTLAHAGADGEDLAATVWLRAWQHRADCRAETEKQRYAWLWTIARNAWLGKIRREAVAARHAGPMPVDAPSPQDFRRVLDARLSCLSLITRLGGRPNDKRLGSVLAKRLVSALEERPVKKNAYWAAVRAARREL